MERVQSFDEMSFGTDTQSPLDIKTKNNIIPSQHEQPQAGPVGDQQLLLPTATMFAALLGVIHEFEGVSNTCEKSCLPKGLLDFDKSDDSTAPTLHSFAAILDLFNGAEIPQDTQEPQRQLTAENFTSFCTADQECLPDFESSRLSRTSKEQFNFGSSSLVADGRKNSHDRSMCRPSYSGTSAFPQSGSSWPPCLGDGSSDTFIDGRFATWGDYHHDETAAGISFKSSRSGRDRIMSDFSGQFSDSGVNHFNVFRHDSLDSRRISACGFSDRTKQQSSLNNTLINSYGERNKQHGKLTVSSRSHSGQHRKSSGQLMEIGIVLQIVNSSMIGQQYSASITYPCLSLFGSTPDATKPSENDIVKSHDKYPAKQRRGCPRTIFRVQWNIGCITKLQSGEGEKTIVSPQFCTNTSLRNIWLMFTIMSQKEVGEEPTAADYNSIFFSIQFTSTSAKIVNFGVECGEFVSKNQSHHFKDAPWSPPTVVGPICTSQLDSLEIEFYAISIADGNNGPTATSTTIKQPTDILSVEILRPSGRGDLLSDTAAFTRRKHQSTTNSTSTSRRSSRAAMLDLPRSCENPRPNN